MKRMKHWFVFLALGFSVTALADTDEDYEEATFTGKKAKPIKRDIKEVSETITTSRVEQDSLRLYPDKVYEGARVLTMDIKFVATCYEAVIRSKAATYGIKDKRVLPIGSVKRLNTTPPKKPLQSFSLYPILNEWM